MSLSPSVAQYLENSHAEYSISEHAQSFTALHTAHAAHVAPFQLAKAVVVTNGHDYKMCVIPAAHRLILNWLNSDYKGNYHLASEAELDELFPDCANGAVPALGQAYNMDVVWDNSLRYTPDIYFEAGDHRHLIHINHNNFIQLMGLSDHATISCTPDSAEYYQFMH